VFSDHRQLQDCRSYTDTTAAVTGALAGLSYGIEGIPFDWLDHLAGYNDIYRISNAMTEALA